MTHLRIVCDSPTHPPKRRVVAVQGFRSIGDGRWTPDTRHGARYEQRDPGVWLMSENVPYSREAHGDMREALARGETARSSYELVCRKCKGSPLRVREPDLFAALNLLARAGESPVPLSKLRAIIERNKRPMQQ
jgi:hypothetical protein